MKAITYRNYGTPEVLALSEVARPQIKPDEVLVKVCATSVTTADWRLRASAFPGVTWLPGRLMFGLFHPKNRILGGDFAGRIDAVGSDVRQFNVGDQVFGFCMHGAHAEYVAVSAGAAIALKPETLSHEEAAALPFGALSALVFLRDFAKIGRGQSVLVVGASGGVGCYAVQIAKHFGAQVTGVCSAANRGLVTSLGADHVIDYASEDFTKSGRRYDVILDTVGATTFARCKASLTPGGRFVPLNFGLREAFQALKSSIFGGKRVVIGVNGDDVEDLEYLKDLLGAGAIRPVIDRRYPLSQIAEAHRYVEARHRRGSVVIHVAGPQPAQRYAA